jgi:hypothetical protein
MIMTSTLAYLFTLPLVLILSLLSTSLKQFHQSVKRRIVTHDILSVRAAPRHISAVLILSRATELRLT